MITQILLNWKRPKNVQKIVTEANASKMIDDVIVWCNHQNPTYQINHNHLRCRLIESTVDFGLTTRFGCGLFAVNDCLLIQDDDILLPDETIRLLYSRWSDEPEIIHGIFGRKPTDQNAYAKDVMGDLECPIVLTRALMVHRKYCIEFFRELPKFRDLLENAKPSGNGEDILFSYVVRNRSGNQNRVWRLDRQELPAPAAIHGREPNHVKHRTEVMRRCQELL